MGLDGDRALGDGDRAASHVERIVVIDPQVAGVVGVFADVFARVARWCPDQFIAWTGDAAPADPDVLMRRIVGRGGVGVG